MSAQSDQQRLNRQTGCCCIGLIYSSIGRRTLNVSQTGRICLWEPNPSAAYTKTIMKLISQQTQYFGPIPSTICTSSEAALIKQQIWHRGAHRQSETKGVHPARKNMFCVCVCVEPQNAVSCRFPWDNVGTRPPHCPLGQCGGPQRCIRKPNFAPNFAIFHPKLPPESFRTLRIRCSRLSRFRLSYSRPNPWELDPVLSQKTFRT